MVMTVNYWPHGNDDSKLLTAIVMRVNLLSHGNDDSKPMLMCLCMLCSVCVQTKAKYLQQHTSLNTHTCAGTHHAQSDVGWSTLP